MLSSAGLAFLIFPSASNSIALLLEPEITPPSFKVVASTTLPESDPVI